MAQSCVIQIKSLAPEQANTIILISPSKAFNVYDMNTVLKRTSKTCAALIITSYFQYKVFFLACLKQEAFDARSDQITNNKNDVHLIMTQNKRLSPEKLMKTTSNQNYNMKLKNFEVNGSDFRFKGNANLNITFSLTETLVGTSYIDLPYNQRSIIKPQNHNDR